MPNQLPAAVSVLAVDDSPVSRKLLEHALESEPCQLLFAADGAEALRLFAEHSPRIVITDWMLPDVSGPDLCRQMRLASRSYAYIIILTSNAEKENLVEGLAAGADHYVTKPFDKQELLARIGVGRRIIELHAQIESKSRQLEELARTDHLTGLPNRRAVEDYGEHQLFGAIRHKFPLWIVLIDIDRFKTVNDTHGHVTGDAVLARVAALLRRNTRAADLCGRLGGDEFILIVSYATQEDIVSTADRLLRTIAEETFDGKLGPFQVTASLGVAGFQGAAADFKQLLDRADRALYAAKESGRNVVKVDIAAAADLPPAR